MGDGLCYCAFSARYEDMASVQAMYAGMAADEQADKINEGKAPMQVCDRGAG